MDRILPLVYDELHAMAHRQLGRRRPGQTLNTTALVHEAYVKLVDQPQMQDGWNDRNHFLSVAAIAMRHILVDYARRRAAKKRGGNEKPVLFDEGELGVEGRVEEILALDEALTQLAELNERLAKIVELRFFGGLKVDEISDVLDVSVRTVKRDWRKARAFLYNALAAGSGSDIPVENGDE